MKLGSCWSYSPFPPCLRRTREPSSAAVNDASGAIVAGAKVTLLNVDTNISQETRTDTSGEYIFTPVRIGNYTVKVDMAGFAGATRPGLSLNVQQRMRVDFTLTVGSVDQSIEIRAESPLLDTSTSSIGQVVQNKSILELPLNGRDYQQLAVLTAGTAPTGGISRGNSDFSANGARPLNNNFLLDGVDNNSYVLDLQSFSSQSVSPSIDALQEFKVQNNNFSAEFGRYGGAVINATLKSGTNDLHGTVFEFLRNNALDANNFFNNIAGRSLPAFRQNQFGGTAGGPLIRNKLFLFGSYQGTRIAQGVTFVSTVPTDDPAQRDLLRRRIYDPATTARQSGRRRLRARRFPGQPDSVLALRSHRQEGGRRLPRAQSQRRGQQLHLESGKPHREQPVRFALRPQYLQPRHHVRPLQPDRRLRHHARTAARARRRPDQQRAAAPPRLMARP